MNKKKNKAKSTIFAKWGRSLYFQNEEFDKGIKQYIEKYNIPAVAVGLIDGEHVSSFQWGTNSYLDNGEKVFFQVGSISKSLTAFGILHLYEQGLLSLDMPVNHYLSRWKLQDNQYADKVTVRTILNHTAGLSMRSFKGSTKKTSHIELEDLLSGHAYHSKPVHVKCEPGQAFLYSGGGYTILQLLIEELSGVSFSKYMKETILEPMGMRSSSFEYEDIKGHLAQSNNVFRKSRKQRTYAEKAAAGLYSDIEDMLYFVRAQTDGNCPVLQPDSIKMSHTRAVRYINTGLGCFVDNFSEGRKLIWHTGNNLGWRSVYLCCPKKQTGIVILTSSDFGQKIISLLVKEWLKDYTGLDIGKDSIRKHKCLESYDMFSLLLQEYLGKTILRQYL